MMFWPALLVALCHSVLFWHPGHAVPLPHCQWVENLTAPIRLAEHKYVILEECLYYDLSKEADKVQEKPSALITLPPTRDVGEKVQINLESMMINQLWINEIWKEMNIAGHIEMSWNDYRLKWDEKKWQMTMLQIKSYGHLWVPDMFTGGFDSASRTNDYTIFKDIQASNTGIVSAKLQYRIQAVCQVDYYDFPVDDRTCCFDLHSNLFSDLVRYNLKTKTGEVDPTDGQTNWELRNVDIAIRKTKDRDQAETIRVCVEARRKSSTLKIELTVPMVITAIIVVTAPLFGKFSHQLYAKLFALLLQFLCFRFLVTKTPQVGFGDRTPKVYKFYEFTLGMTVLSFIITLILSALARVNRTLPPSHRLVLTASAFNTYLCCTEGTDEKSTGAGSNKDDWAQIFAFANNILSVVLMFAYVLGVLVLCM